MKAYNLILHQKNFIIKNTCVVYQSKNDLLFLTQEILLATLPNWVYKLVD